MANTINIYDPKADKYGPLSNLERKSLEIEGQIWTSPQNYIYTNLLKNKLYKQQVKNVKKTSKVYDIFKKMYDKTISETLFEGYFNGYKSLLEKTPELSAKLLQTGDKKIVYRSENTLIGSNKNVGKNIIGTVLESLRYRIKNILDKKSEQEKLYKIYIAYNFLKDLLYDHKNIDQFLGKDFEEFVSDPNIIPDDYRMTDFNIRNIDINSDIVISTIYNLDLTTIDNIINYIKKTESRKYREEIYTEKRVIVLNSYIEYLVERNYPDLDDRQKIIAIIETREQLLKHNEKDILDTIYVSYKENLLPKDLSEKIDNIIHNEKKLPDTPDIKDIEKAEQIVFEKISIKAPLKDEHAIAQIKKVKVKNIKNILDNLILQTVPLDSESPLYKKINNIATLKQIIHNDKLQDFIEEIKNRISEIKDLLKDNKLDEYNELLNPEDQLTKEDLQNELYILNSLIFTSSSSTEIKVSDYNPEFDKKFDLSELIEDKKEEIEKLLIETKDEKFRQELLDKLELIKDSRDSGDSKKLKEMLNILNIEIPDKLFKTTEYQEINTELSPEEIKDKIIKLDKKLEENIQRNLEIYIRLTKDEDIKKKIERVKQLKLDLLNTQKLGELLEDYDERSQEIATIKANISKEKAHRIYERELKKYKQERRREKRKEKGESQSPEVHKHKRPILTRIQTYSEPIAFGIEGDLVLSYLAGTQTKQEIVKGFSPDLDSDIIIDGLVYKSITHYVITLLYYKMVLSIRTMEDAYAKILTPLNTFKSIQEISVDYTNDYLEDRRIYTERNCIVAMNQKFNSDKKLIKLLKSTGTATIIYQDKQDEILGVGPSNNGLNFVGKYLEYLRQHK